jgi:hypothetical protein
MRYSRSRRRWEGQAASGRMPGRSSRDRRRRTQGGRPRFCGWTWHGKAVSVGRVMGVGAVARSPFARPYALSFPPLRHDSRPFPPVALSHRLVALLPLANKLQFTLHGRRKAHTTAIPPPTACAHAIHPHPPPTHPSPPVSVESHPKVGRVIVPRQHVVPRVPTHRCRPIASDICERSSAGACCQAPQPAVGRLAV